MNERGERRLTKAVAANTAPFLEFHNALCVAKLINLYTNLNSVN